MSSSTFYNNEWYSNDGSKIATKVAELTSDGMSKSDIIRRAHDTIHVSQSGVTDKKSSDYRRKLVKYIESERNLLLTYSEQRMGQELQVTTRGFLLPSFAFAGQSLLLVIPVGYLLLFIFPNSSITIILSVAILASISLGLYLLSKWLRRNMQELAINAFRKGILLEANTQVAHEYENALDDMGA